MQYNQVKSQLGYGTTRVHLTNGVYLKFGLGFVSSIIRFEIGKAAKAIVIEEMNLLEIVKINNAYTCAHAKNSRQLEVLKALNLDKNLLDTVVSDENNRSLGKIRTPRKPDPNNKKQLTPSKTKEKKPGSKIKNHPEMNKNSADLKINKESSLKQKLEPRKENQQTSI